ncbi:MAG: M13 family metallopeptidase [Thermomicrobiales bacterium]|nr:M13 family metallopeptidase [Thermomicrobiales bacterium]
MQRRASLLGSIVVAVGLLLGGILSAVAQPATHGIDVANMDLSVNPADDFYRFANGGWLDRVTIPANRPAFNTFIELSDENRTRQIDLLNAAADSGAYAPESDQGKAISLFQQGLDVETRNRLGVAPIQPILDEIAAIDSVDAYNAFLEGSAFKGVQGTVPVFVMADLNDASMNALYLGGPWLGLPNRDYYFDDDPGNERIREAYLDAGASMLGFAGVPADVAHARAEAVYALEKQLAEPTLTREQSQDVSLSNNPMSVAEIAKLYPGMDWTVYLTDLGVADQDRIIVTEKTYLEQLSPILAGADPAVLRDYLTLQVLWNFSNNLSEEMERVAFEYFGRALRGQEEQSPVAERVLGQVNGLMGQAVGQLYVEKYFPPEAKAAIDALVDEVILAFGQRLDVNTWMSPETKVKAHEKLAAMGVKVGFPDTWRTYEQVELGDSYAASVLSAANSEARRELAKAGHPVDRAEWDIPPQTVNAFYSPLDNQIVFPAGILQPPFFDYQADPASNYGAIGYVIGHEITHGFDLQGSQFDAQGNLANWWTDEDRARFLALNDRLVAQYDAIEAMPGLFVNGQITVTENAADLGGIQVAHDALLHTLETTPGAAAIDATPLIAVPAAGEATPVEAGATPAARVAVEPPFTEEQRLFIAAASVWREKVRDAYLETLIKTDTHAPAEVRATQPLRNMDAFFTAFGITPGDPMYLPPDQRVVIW